MQLICYFGCAGKSSLSHRFADGDFDEEYNPTIENTLTTQVNYKVRNAIRPTVGPGAVDMRRRRDKTTAWWSLTQRDR